MIVTSTVVMFVLMYLNTYSLDHIYWSETRAYMALVMGATMALIMLGFMLGMYTSRTMNLGIPIGQRGRVRLGAIPRPQPGNRRGRRLD